MLQPYDYPGNKEATNPNLKREHLARYFAFFNKYVFDILPHGNAQIAAQVRRLPVYPLCIINGSELRVLLAENVKSLMPCILNLLTVAVSESPRLYSTPLNPKNLSSLICSR
jgi:hypothetical protein